MQERAKVWIKRFITWMDARPRQLFWYGAVLVLWMALWSSKDMLPMSRNSVLGELTKKEDIHNLYFAAVNSTWRDIPKWWVGSWIYPDVYYYRPITSMLFFFEQRAFDQNFTAYNRVTWLLHGLNALLLYALTVSLFDKHRRARILLGLVAVYYFVTPAGSMFFGIDRALSWWPAQNDVLSLTFALLCLFLLDRHLLHPHPLLAMGGLLAFAASVMSKEMGYITMPMAVALIWYRRRHATMLMAAYIALAGALWVFRKIVVPNPWSPVLFRAWILQKAMLFMFRPLYIPLRPGEWWYLAASLSVILAGVIGWRLRLAIYWIVAICLLAVCVCAQFVGEEGSFLLPFIATSYITLRDMVMFLVAALLFWRYRRSEPGVFAASALLLCYVPILQYGGKHYFYWPASLQGLANAAFCVCLWRRVCELLPDVNWGVLISYVDVSKRKAAEAETTSGDVGVPN